MSNLEAVDTGDRLWGNPNSGRWATERMLEALALGEDISAAHLRTNGTLLRDEWILFDEALMQEGELRLRGVADLIAAGLTRPIPNALGTTVIQWQNIGSMTPASVSMDGMARTENDTVEFGEGSAPVPIIHKDFFLNIRRLQASRKRGESLDTTQARMAGRKVMEEAERMLFQGGKTFGGYPIYGYLTHPHRNTMGFGAGGSWALVAKTGQQMLDDLLAGIEILIAEMMYGPYWVYVGSVISNRLNVDFKANGNQSIRTRLLEVENVAAIRSVDQMPANAVLIVQATPDVVQLAQGEPLQTIQWDVQGGMGVNFKAFMIQVPIIRSDPEQRSGILHIS
jgi:uncharacterized linocin/CFP29 family protein